MENGEIEPYSLLEITKMELAKMEILSKMDEGLWLTDVYILTNPLLSPTETIKQSHSSYPYNPIMAEVLYRTTSSKVGVRAHPVSWRHARCRMCLNRHGASMADSFV